MTTDPMTSQHLANRLKFSTLMPATFNPTHKAMSMEQIAAWVGGFPVLLWGAENDPDAVNNSRSRGAKPDI